MTPFWFIQETHSAADCQRLFYTIKSLGMDVEVHEYTPFGQMNYDFIPSDRPVIFNGGLNVVKDVQRRHANVFHPFAWCDWEALSCRKYYTHYGEFLLQDRYGFYPIGELPRLKDLIYELYGVDDCVFIRPDTNDKVFTGEVVEKSRLISWQDIACWERKPELLCVVAQPKKILAEYRLVVANGKVVAGSGYRAQGYFEVIPDYPAEATAFAEKVAAKWSPHPIYCMDVAETPHGFRLVEIGSVNCAGFYDMNVEAVVKAMAEIAIKEWHERLD